MKCPDTLIACPCLRGLKTDTLALERLVFIQKYPASRDMNSKNFELNLLSEPEIFSLLKRDNGGRLYSRTVIMQDKFIAERNRILNCDRSLRSL